MLNNESKRIFKKGESVYVIDHWGMSSSTGSFIGSGAIETCALILEVDDEFNSFTAVLYDDTYQEYSFDDYKIIIFDTESEASKAAKRLPSPMTTLYVVDKNKICKRIVSGIAGEYVGPYYKLFIELDRGQMISINEIDKSVFLYESDAKKKIK